MAKCIERYYTTVFHAVCIFTLICMAVTFLTNTIATRRLHVGYMSGRRTEQECVNYYLEAETSRWAGYKAFEKNKTTLHVAVIFMNIAMVLLVSGICVMIFMHIRMTTSIECLREEAIAHGDSDPKYLGRIEARQLKWWEKWIGMVGSITFAVIYVIIFSSVAGAIFRPGKMYEQKKQRDAMLGLYLPSLLVFVFMGVWHEDTILSKYAVWIVLYIVVFLLGFLYKMDFTSMSSINYNYRSKLSELNTKMEALVTSLQDASKFKDIYDSDEGSAVSMFKTIIGNNIKMVEDEKGNAIDVFNAYASKKALAQYMMHEGGGELKDFEDQLPALSVGTYSAATNKCDASDATSKDTACILKDIRSAMDELRRMTEYDNKVKSCMKHTLWFAVVVFGALFFGIYHYFYVINPDVTIVAAALSVLVFIMVVAFYGSISSAVLM